MNVLLARDVAGDAVGGGEVEHGAFDIGTVAGDEGDTGAALEQLANEAAPESGRAAGDGDAQVVEAVVGHVAPC